MRDYLIRKARDFPYGLLSRFKNLNPENAISLFCDPRGGSTWLAEIINNISDSFIIEEPLHLHNMKALRALNFSWRQYIPDDASWEEANAVFQRILQGRMLNAGVCRINSIPEIFKANQAIIKVIRGKALLPWYVNQFNFRYQPLMVVRNPFALAASRMNHEAWNYEYSKFEIPDSPYNEILKKHESFLYSLMTKEEQLTALWCIVNNVVLSHPKNNRAWISMNYEDLVLNPQKSIEKIFNQWGLDVPEKLMSKIMVPSSSTRGKKQIDPNRILSDWQDKLKPNQIDALQKVLDYFEVKHYSKEHFLPLIPADQVHLKKA